MIKKYFGTDGIRGPLGVGPVNPEFVLKLGWAAGKVFAEKAGHSKLLIGKDTRISGYMFESALEAGLVAAGVNVGMLGPMPTPAVAYLTRTLHAQAGIVISASHNTYQDNGIKFFSSAGVKLADELELAIEQQLLQPMTTVNAVDLGKVERINDAPGRYIEFCKNTVPTGFSLQGLKLVVDCAHGATYQIAPKVLTELGAEVIAIGVQPDGLNINEQCGSTQPKVLQGRVIAEQADLGIAFDGDGDRVIFVDARGEVLDGDELLFILAKDSLRRNGECAGVVGTLTSNLGLERALQAESIPFVRAQVGDRYVNEMMCSHGWQLGGESSGHIICGDVVATGDGLVAALRVLFALVDSGDALHVVKSLMQKLPQTVINVETTDGSELIADKAIQSAVVAVEKQLANSGRVLLRPSGTEPVIRVMVEGEDSRLVSRLANDIAAVVRHQL